MDSNNINAMQAMNCNMDGLSFNYSTTSDNCVTAYQGGDTLSTGYNANCITNGINLTCWDYWHGYYYPQVIRESYPVYIQEQAKDKGKAAFEIIKGMIDKKFIKLDTVKQFVDLMDFLIKTI
jgi:hypothetical protein